MGKLAPTSCFVDGKGQCLLCPRLYLTVFWKATLPARADPVGSPLVLKDLPAPPRMLDDTKGVVSQILSSITTADPRGFIEACHLTRFIVRYNTYAL